MSLETCSLILFFSMLCTYMMTFLSLFHNPSITKYSMLFAFWLINVGVTLWYGIYTEQIGFILIAGTEIIISIFVYVITAKAVKDDSL